MTVSPLAEHADGADNLAMLRRAAVIAASCACAMSACVPSVDVDPDLLSGLPRYDAQRKLLCERGRQNAVTAAFCVDGGPRIDSLASLMHTLDLDLGVDDSPAFTLVAHSTAIGSRSI